MRKFEQVKRLEMQIKLPERSTAKSAGYDFFAYERVEIEPYKLGDNPVMVKTGVKVEMPDDEYLMLVNRSSNPKKKKIKHVSFSGVRNDSAHEKLMSAGTLTDKAVRVALSDFLSKYEK